MSKTFTTELLMDYTYLHEQYDWVPPTEPEAYDEDPNTGEYVNPQYWVTPWTDEDLKEYEIFSVVSFYNVENGTDIDPEDVKSFTEVERNAYSSTYQFTV